MFSEILVTFAFVTSMTKSVILSFDDGPSSLYTNQILQILKENDIKANFFLVGEMLEKNSQLVEQEVAQGHQIGGHSISHKELTKIPLEKAKYEILESMRLVNKYQKSDLFRFPYGSHSKALDKIVEDNGYKAIFWNTDSLDWKIHDSEAICNRVVVRLAKDKNDNDIVLFHDIHPQTIQALREVVKYIKDNNIQTKTIEE